MTMKRVPLSTVLALLLACAPALADGLPAASAPSCAAALDGLTLPDPVPLACPGSFCFDDQQCQSICPSDPNAFCNLQTGTCSYPGSGGGPGGGNCSSGSICSPGRFCNDDGDCASCWGGCPGYCAADSVCRLI